ncbi:MAG: butyrate kinase [Eubacterium sp.]|nr:butyrate kinase [Eubacterium sp.]
MSYKIFAINPGSTSTKIALIDGGNVLFAKNVSHDADKLAEFNGISAQLPYRKETILNLLKENDITLDDVDAFVGRGGGLMAMEGGTYKVDALVLDHATRGANGIQHPAQLGPQIANEFAKEYDKPAFVVNPPDVDEMQDVARMTGIKGVYRIMHLHSLNLKETAIRHAATLGKKYEDCNFVVCHIGGGISVSAHRAGRMVDGFDIVSGEGPMAPTRCGSISVAQLVDYAEGKDLRHLRHLCTRSGGFVSHLGISDAIELTERAANGDKYADMVWNSMIYQINKAIGSMASVLHGKIDGILLGGGMVHSKDLVAKIREANEWIAPVTAYPGEFEMEAMAAGASRVLSGEEEVKTYTGVNIFRGFDFAGDFDSEE